MVDIDSVIKNMPEGIRSKAQAFAQKEGISLAAAVEQQLNQEISDEDLASVSGAAMFTEPYSEVETTEAEQQSGGGPYHE